MSPVTQCDTCKTIGPAPPPPHWIALVTVGEPATFAQAVFGTGGPDVAGTFCCWWCVATFAAQKALSPGLSGLPQMPPEAGEKQP